MVAPMTEAAHYAPGEGELIDGGAGLTPEVIRPIAPRYDFKAASAIP